MSDERNDVHVQRSFNGQFVTVFAQYEEADDTWKLSARLNGVLIDTRTTTDIWLEIPDMIDCAFQDHTVS